MFSGALIVCWIMVYMVALYWIQVNSMNLRLFWQAWLLQMMTWVSLVVLTLLQITRRHHVFPSIAFMVFMGLFILMLLVRLGFIVDSYRRVPNPEEGRLMHSPDRNLSAGFVRWDMFTSTAIVLVFLYSAYYGSFKTRTWIVHAVFWGLVFGVFPWIVLVPFLRELPDPDLEVARRGVAATDWVRMIRDERAVASAPQLAPWNLLDVMVHPEVDSTVAFFEDVERKDLMIVFSSTRSLRNWRSDLNIAHVPVPEDWKMSRPMHVHRGFLHVYTTLSSELQRKLVHFTASRQPERVFFIGHSLGGALAVLAGAHAVVLSSDAEKLHVYTYGAPQVGDGLFVEWFDATIKHAVRFVNPYDPVPESLRMQLVHTKGYYPVVVAKGSLPFTAHHWKTYYRGLS